MNSNMIQKKNRNQQNLIYTTLKMNFNQLDLFGSNWIYLDYQNLELNRFMIRNSMNQRYSFSF